MNFNLVEMYNGLLRFNKHILNELAEGQDTDKAVRVLLLSGCATDGSLAGSGYFTSAQVWTFSSPIVGFFTTVKLD